MLKENRFNGLNYVQESMYIRLTTVGMTTLTMVIYIEKWILPIG